VQLSTKPRVLPIVSLTILSSNHILSKSNYFCLFYLFDDGGNELFCSLYNILRFGKIKYSSHHRNISNFASCTCIHTHVYDDINSFIKLIQGTMLDTQSNLRNQQLVLFLETWACYVAEAHNPALAHQVLELLACTTMACSTIFFKSQ
jgi:hypothetical protein